MAKSVPSDCTHLTVYVQPRASRECITALKDNVVHIKLRAAPVDGKANEALIKFLAGYFKINKSAIKIVRGEKARQKVVAFQGTSPGALISTIKMNLQLP